MDCPAFKALVSLIHITCAPPIPRLSSRAAFVSFISHDPQFSIRVMWLLTGPFDAELGDVTTISEYTKQCIAHAR